MLDTLSIAKDLEKNGLPRNQAEVVALAMAKYTPSSRDEWKNEFIYVGFSKGIADTLISGLDQISATRH